MSRQLATALAEIRNKISQLSAEDKDNLIKIGASLEEFIVKNENELGEVASALMLSLEALQSVYLEQIPDFTIAQKYINAVLVASEQNVATPPNPISSAMLANASETLKNLVSDSQVNQTDGQEIQSETEIEEVKTEESIVEIPNNFSLGENPSLDEIASFLIQIEISDSNNLNKVCEALKKISSETEDVEQRKLLVKAAREVKNAADGNIGEEAISNVGNLIDEVNALRANEDESIEEKSEISKETETPEISEILGTSHPDNEISSEDFSMIAEFATESSELLEAAEAMLLQIESEPDNMEAVNTVFRAFHTIKGTSAFLGLSKLSGLAHLAESILSRIRNREISCTGGYADLALRSVDMLKAFLFPIQNNSSIEANFTPNGYDELMEFLANPEKNGFTEENNSTVAVDADAESKPKKGKKDNILRIGDVLVAQKKLTREQVEKAFEVKGMELFGDTLVNLGLITNLDLKEALEYQKQVFTEQTSKQKAEWTGGGESSVRVRTDRLDMLIDMVGELVIAQAMLSQDEEIKKGRFPELSRKVSHAGKIVRELQDLSMAMRMIPLRSTFQKIARVVRDVALKSKKGVEFINEGSETEIDRNMVDLIADPLVHLVRNAVDHGIETTQARKKAGKTSQGTIRLAAYHAGGDVVIELTDDGAGLNKAKIIEKAIANKLIESEQGLSENQIFNLIFAPGFSTAAVVTDVSGRGVGMDVVKRNIEAMRGRIQIASEAGKGTTFTIRLPLTLAITDGMLVRVGEERYIIPTTSIFLSFQPKASQLSTITGRSEMVSLRGELMPIFRLHKLFETKNANEDLEKGLLVIIADGRRRCAILVDELLGQQQAVVKSLGRGIGKIDGVAGGAILGDGQVGLILDTTEIVAFARQNTSELNRKNSKQEKLSEYEKAA